MASKLTPEQIARFREAFGVFDKDGDGSITEKEVKEVLVSLGYKPTDQDAKDFIKDYDYDGSNSIQFDEYLLVMAERERERELYERFKELDLNNDETIDALELKKSLKEFTLDEANDLLDELINSGTGVTFEHFVKIMNSNQK